MNCVYDSQKDSNDIIGIFRMFDFRHPGAKIVHFSWKCKYFATKMQFFNGFACVYAEKMLFL